MDGYKFMMISSPKKLWTKVDESAITANAVRLKRLDLRGKQIPTTVRLGTRLIMTMDIII